MGSDQHLAVIASSPSLAFSLGSTTRIFLFFYDAPPPSSHSKELGQSRWLVFTMYPSARGLFLILSTYTVVCFVPRTVCLDYIVIWLFDAAPVLFLLRYVEIVGIKSPASLPSTRRAFPGSKTRPTRLPSTSPANMTSEVGKNQILAKWQEAFTRLNGNQPGIAGLMDFTKVRGVFLCLVRVGH
jgi:hypothetical protein